jgi:hypothetical protein
MALDKYNLSNDGEQWKLSKRGAERASETYPGLTKEEAVHEAAKFMHEHPGSMKIRNLNNTISEERTYPRSADPKRSPG